MLEIRPACEIDMTSNENDTKFQASLQQYYGWKKQNHTEMCPKLEKYDRTNHRIYIALIEKI